MSANTIQLDGEGYRRLEAIANEAMYPGNIVELMSTGKIKKHATAGGFGLVLVAVEDALQGNTTATQYASAARVLYHHQTPGTRFQALLVSGETIVIGDMLISDGAGRLKKTTGTPSQIFAYAEEACDLSASTAVDTLIAVRAAG
jgi:hypothetical protein